MRWLTFIILSSLFFLASPESEAAGRIEFKSKQQTAFSSPAKLLYAIFESADAGSIAFPQTGLRTPLKQYRSVSGIHANFIDLPLLAEERLAVQFLPTKAFSHCVPIGLKLLFPKHYFW